MGFSHESPLPGGINHGDIRTLKPSEALTTLLAAAQADHHKCVTKALAAQADPVDKCALTWGEVVHRYRQFGNYRPPFENQSINDTHRAFWTPKNVTRYEMKMSLGTADS